MFHLFVMVNNDLLAFFLLIYRTVVVFQHQALLSDAFSALSQTVCQYSCAIIRIELQIFLKMLLHILDGVVTFVEVVLHMNSLAF